MMENVKLAIKLFKELMMKGELRKRDYPELYSVYLEVEVQEVLTWFEEEFECRFLSFDDTIYLLPNIGSDVLGILPSDLKDYFGSNPTKRDVFLGYYIMMFILFEFFNGKNKDPKMIDYLQISHLISRLDQRFESLSKPIGSEIEEMEEDFEMERDNISSLAELEEKWHVNLSSSIDIWRNMLVYHETKKKTKYNTILAVCKILEDQKLAYVVEDQIRTTKKLDILMRQYYLSSERVRSINAALEKGEL